MVYDQIKSEFNVLLTMIELKNIYSLTDFKRNAKEFVERIRATQAPIVLTVNGKAEVVVQDAQAFQTLCDRVQKAEEEIRSLRLTTLKQDVELGVKQLKNGDYTEYGLDDLPKLLENIKSRNHESL